jgi:MFS family permease
MFNSYRDIFANRAYRLFWSGFTLSALGDSMSRVALTWFVYETTQSAEALGWLMVCYTGPIIVGGLLAGALLDRFNRRSVMLVDNLIRGAAFVTIPLLYGLGQLALWHVYLVAAVYGLLWMISLAGGPALIPSLVRREQLVTANALEVLGYTVGSVIGPALAGVLISWMGAPYVVLVDALSYFVFAFTLARIPVGSVTHTTTTPDGKTYRLQDAVRLLLTNPILLSTTLMYQVSNVGGGGFLAVGLPILCAQTLSGGSELYGSLLGLMALGEVASTVFTGGRTLPLPLGTLICLALMLGGGGLALLLLGNQVWLVALGLVLFGAFTAPLTTWAQTLRMQIIPEGLRGRTFALLRTLMQSGNPVGGALGGALLPLLGVPMMIALSALLVGVPGVLGYQVKALREAGRPQAVQYSHST